jgi:hypothetical protein
MLITLIPVNILLFVSLENRRYRLLLISLLILSLIALVGYFIKEIAVKICLSSLSFIAFHYMNIGINNFMGHVENDTNLIRRIQKFVRTKLIYIFITIGQLVLLLYAFDILKEK